MEPEKLGPRPVSESNRTNNQPRSPYEQNARNLELIRQAVIGNVNRLSAQSFSHQVVQVLLARQRIVENETENKRRQPERAPSPEEQPRPSNTIAPARHAASGAISKEMATAMEETAKKIRRAGWAKENE